MAEDRRQKEAFEYFYALDKRTYTAVSAKMKVTVMTISNWAQKYQWSKRCDTLDRELWEATRTAMIRDRVKTDLRHIDLYRKAQANAEAEVEVGDFKDAGQAVNALDTAIKGEREVSGYRPVGPSGSADLTQVNINNLQVNEISEAKQIASDIKGKANGSGKDILEMLGRIAGRLDKLVAGGSKKNKSDI